MSLFSEFIEFLLGISLLVSTVTTYLVINKLWSRKGDKEVAASISISAALLGLATGVPFLIEYAFFDHHWAATGTSTLGIVKGVVYVLVGAGIWVKENRGVGFFTVFFRALRVERKESGNLVKALAQPKGRGHVDALKHHAGPGRVHRDHRARRGGPSSGDSSGAARGVPRGP